MKDAPQYATWTCNWCKRKGRRGRDLLSFQAIICSIFLIFYQVVPYSAYAQNPVQTVIESQAPTVDPLAPATSEPSPQVASTASEFLISPVTLSEAMPEMDTSYFKDFGYVFETLSQEGIATAAIVDSLTEENIKQLMMLDHEVAILVLYGEIALVTSGEENQIRLLNSVKDLVAGSLLTAHTHLDSEKPSQNDFASATQLTEYVITKNGITAYNEDGILAEDQEISVLLNAIRQAREDWFSTQSDEVDARAALNEFIHSMDQFSQVPDQEKFVFRSGPTPLRTLYVDQNYAGSVSNGSVAQPWKTIKEAANQAQAGDLIYIKAGHYVESSANDDWSVATLNPANSGTKINPIIFRAFPGDTVFISNDETNGASAIGVSGRNYIYWEGFVTDRGISIFDSIGSEVAYTEVIGQYAATTDNHDGIRIERSDSIHIHHNSIHGVTGDSQNSAGIKVYTSSNVLVEDNDIYGNTVGIFDKDSGLNNTYRRNYFHSNDQVNFLGNNQGADATFFIYDNVFDGTGISLLEFNDGSQIHNNLFRFDTVQTVLGTWINTMDTLTNIQAWNNVILSTTSNVYGWSQGWEFTGSDLTYLDYNVYSTSTAYSIEYVREVSVSEMQSKGFEQHSSFNTSSSAIYSANWILQNNWLAAGRYGDNIGPADVPLILDLTRYGPSGAPSFSITNLTATKVTARGATINWTTDVAANGQVEFRVQGTNEWQQQVLWTGLTTNHSIGLYGLETTTTYEYKIRSKDAAGNLEVSSIGTFTTGEAAVVLINQAWLNAQGAGPYYLNQADTNYVLQQDVTTKGTAFVVSAVNVRLDLNGHTITYDNAPPITVPNGSFENGTTGWDFSAAPNAEVYKGVWIQNQVYDGDYSLKFTFPNSNQSVTSANMITLEANTTYSLSAMFNYGMQSNTVNPGVKMYVRLVGANGEPTREAYWDGTNWRGIQLREGTFTTGSTAETYRIMAGIENASAETKTMWAFIDDIKIQKTKVYGVLLGAYSWSAGNHPDATVGGPRPYGASVINGTIIQGQDNATWAHGIFENSVSTIGANSNIKIDNLHITVSGANSSVINMSGSVDDVITNNVLTSNVKTITSRDNMHGAMVIGVNGVVANNTLMNGPHAGLVLGNGDSQIYNNHIQLKVRYTNAFAIIAGHGSEIYNNVVDCGHDDYTCRGIMVTSGTADNPTIAHDNTIAVQGFANNQEYGGPSLGGVYGMQLENAHDVEVYNNSIIAYGVGTDAYAFRVNSDGGTSSTIYAHDNIFRAISNGGSAAVLKFSAVADGVLRFEDNTLITNEGMVGNSEESTVNLVRSHIQIVNPIADAHPFEAGWTSKTDPIHVQINFIDSMFSDPASYDFIANAVFRNPRRYGGTISSRGAFALLYSTTIDVHDSAYQAVPNASVSIKDKNGNEIFSGQTDALGVVSVILKQFQTQGSVKTEYNPYLITVTSADLIVTQSITANQIQTVEMRLGSTTPPPDITAPTISSVTSMNVTETSAVITWVTDEASDSQVEYRVQGASIWQFTGVDTGLVTDHVINLVGLDPATTYEFQVKSKDDAGNLQTSVIQTVTTLNPPPVMIASAPEAPRVLINTDYDPAYDRSADFVINDTGDAIQNGVLFQAALDNAQLGQIIELQAGAVFQGNFKLTSKTGEGWIYIRSSNLNQLPEGQRVGMEDAVNMPKLIPRDAQLPIIRTEFGAHNYYISGVEVSTDQGMVQLISTGYGIPAGKTSVWDTTAAGIDSELPYNITFDRMLVHSTSDEFRSRIGINLNGHNMAVINSYIANIKDLSDAQAILVFNGGSGYKIVNNFLEGTGENVMFGGNDPKILNAVPSDIEIRGNYFYKRLEWNHYEVLVYDSASGQFVEPPRDAYGTIIQSYLVGKLVQAKWDPTHTFTWYNWTMKNLLEFKNAERVLVEGNILENSWTDGQQGAGILVTPRNQNGTCPLCVTQDINFENNIIRNVARGIVISGEDNNHASQQTKRIRIANNVMEDVNRLYNGNSRFFQVTTPSVGGAGNPGRPVLDLIVEHNTFLYDQADASGNMWFQLEATGVMLVQNLVLINNITAHGDYRADFQYVINPTVMNNAIFLDPDERTYSLYRDKFNTYYPDNFKADTIDQVGFADWRTGDYRLLDTSAFHNMATDGTDIGVNIDLLLAALSCTLAGDCGSVAPDITPPVITNVLASNVTETAATMTWTTNEPSDSQVEYRVQGSSIWLSTGIDTSLVTEHSMSLTGLDPATVYEFQVKSKDEAGNLETSVVQTVTTLNLPPVMIAEPALPVKVVDTSLDPSYDRTADLFVRTSCLGFSNCYTDLQQALNNVQAGQIIELEAGATFTGNFTLPNKTGNEWIYIRSSDYKSLAEGTRVGSEDAQHMAKIVTPNRSAAIQAEFGAHNFRFVGIEVTGTNTSSDYVDIVYNLVLLGYNNTLARGALSTEEMAHHIIFDRTYIHGTTTGGYRNGVSAFAYDVAVINSEISEIHAVADESHGFLSVSSSGPIKIDNNLLEVAGINVMLGQGSGTTMIDINRVPTDVTITNNVIRKSLTWKVDDPSYAGIHWLVKNLTEFKMGRRILYDGNILEHSWADAQIGWGIVITPREQIVEDVTIRNNVIRGVLNGFSIVPANNTIERVLITNNLVYDVAFGLITTQGSAGGAIHDITITHNTMLSGADGNHAIFMGGESPAADGVIVKDNLMSHGRYGFIGNNTGVGTVSSWYVNYEVQHNALIGGNPDYYNSHYDNGFNDLLFPVSNAAVGFTDTAFNDVADFGLVSSSSYHNAATDGTDIGVNMDLLLAALSCTLAGDCGPVAPDTTAPVIVITSTVPTLTNQTSLTINYTSDGVAKSKDFALTIEGINHLVISETDQAGNTSEVSYDVTLDTIAPVIVVTSQIPAVTNSQNLTVNYTSDGIAKSKSFTLLEGLNNLSVTETDRAGNIGTKNFSITFDSKAPVIVIASRLPEFTNQSNLAVTYTVDNGAPQTKSFTLTEGKNDLFIEAKDLAGNTTRVDFSVVLDTVPPVIAITSPIPSLTNNPNLAVAYTVDGGRSQTQSFTLVDGRNELFIQAVDQAGNRSRFDFRVTYHANAPHVVIKDKIPTSTDQSTLTVDYTVNNRSEQTAAFSLEEGTNDLAFEVKDGARTWEASLPYLIVRVQNRGSYRSPVRDEFHQLSLNLFQEIAKRLPTFYDLLLDSLKFTDFDNFDWFKIFRDYRYRPIELYDYWRMILKQETKDRESSIPRKKIKPKSAKIIIKDPNVEVKEPYEVPLQQPAQVPLNGAPKTTPQQTEAGLPASQS